MPRETGTRPRVVIIGGGFGGLYAARVLKRASADVTLIDRTNHHVFQPLLYQVAMATLAPSDVTAPIRFLLRRHRNTTVLMGEVTEVDMERRVVRVDDGALELPYDYLIMASGSRHSYFGHDDWERCAPGLKTIVDAIEIRHRFLLAFEQAEKSDDPQERNLLLTFVIVGAGPTGVELAGILPEVAKEGMRGDFRTVDTDKVRVILLEGGPRVLPTYPERLSRRAHRDLEDLGVEVRVNAMVSHVDGSGVRIGDEVIPARSVFWAAGNEASPLGKDATGRRDKVGRVQVERDLSVPGHPEVFVVGDLALFEQDGSELPGVAPVAMQQGQHAAQTVIRSIQGKQRRAFRYRDKGSLASIGRNRAVADFGRIRLTGAPAWWLWLFIHIMYLAGFRNRLSVLVEWAYAYFTRRRGARLIAGAAPGRIPTAGGTGSPRASMH